MQENIYLKEEMEHIMSLHSGGAHHKTSKRFSDILNSFEGLDGFLEQYSLESVLGYAASLASCKELQPHALRLEMLSQLACICCKGHEPISAKKMVAILQQYLEPLAILEDPPEDVFIDNLMTNTGNFRVFPGIDESVGFWVQELIDTVFKTSFEGKSDLIRGINALLTLSDSVAERGGLKTYTSFNYQLDTKQPFNKLVKTCNPSNSCFEPHELLELGINIDDLKLFAIHEDDVSSVMEEGLDSSNSPLRCKPIIFLNNGKVLLGMPTACCNAIRAHILGKLQKYPEMHEYFVHKQLHLLQRYILPSMGITPASKLKIGATTPGTWDVVQVSGWYDYGKIASVICLFEPLKDLEDIDFHEPRLLSKEQKERFEQYLVNTCNSLSENKDVNGGMLILIGCGLGKGYNFGTGALSFEWKLVNFGLADIYLLAQDGNFSALKLDKLETHIDKVERDGVNIMCPWGTATLYSSWQEEYGGKSEWALLPKGLPYTKNAILQITPDWVLRARKKSKKSFNRHVFFRPSSKSRLVIIRKTLHGITSERDLEEIYVFPDSLETEYLGIIEKNNSHIILSAKFDDSFGEWQKSFLFNVWEATLNWAHDILCNIPEFRSLGTIEVNLSIENLASLDRENIKNLDDEDEYNHISYLVSDDGKNIDFLFKGSWIKLLEQPENTGDSCLVAELIKLFWSLVNTHPISEIVLEKHKQKVIRDKFQRHIHVFTGHNFRDYFRDSQPRNYLNTLYPNEDVLFVQDGLAWEISTQHAAEDGAVKLVGKEALQFLEKVTSHLWESIEKDMSHFTPASLIEASLLNLEFTAMESDYWSWTSASVSAFHKDSKKLAQAIIDFRAEMDTANLVYRTIIEIASYASNDSDDARICSRLDIDRLFGKVQNLLNLSRDRDAYKALSQNEHQNTVLLQPNGNIDSNKYYMEDVVAPYLMEQFRRGYEADIANYEKRYSKPKIDKTKADFLEPLFLSSYLNEYGISLSDTRNLIDVLEDYGLEKKKLVFQMKESELIKMFREATDLSESSLQKYLHRQSIYPRKEWNEELPDGYKKESVFPWRYQRPYSVLSRPFIKINLTEDPTYLISPGLIRHSFAYILNNTYYAEFNEPKYFVGGHFKSWFDAENNRQGDEFNKRVAERLTALGWNTVSNKSMGSLGFSEKGTNLGEVDVLAWNNQGIVLVIECKNLKFAMTTYEIFNQLEKFHKDGKEHDLLEKHMNRCRWIRDNISGICAVTGLEEVKKVVPILATSRNAPMRYVELQNFKKEQALDIYAINKKNVTRAVRACADY